MSFILDALRKSEHERQRSEVPGLSQVPLATPQPQLPRWALAVIGVLVAAVLVLGGAWWQSTSAPAELAPAPTVERSVELPPPSLRSAVPQQAAPSRPLSQDPGGVVAREPRPPPTPRRRARPARPRSWRCRRSTRADSPTERPRCRARPRSPPKASLLPTLRLELHAFSAQPRERFVFINGRKYVEGERLVEGPQLVAIEPTGAVLTHAGRRFLLVQE